MDKNKNDAEASNQNKDIYTVQDNDNISGTLSFTEEDLIDHVAGLAEYERRDAEADPITTIEQALLWYQSLEETVLLNGVIIIKDGKIVANG